MSLSSTSDWTTIQGQITVPSNAVKGSLWLHVPIASGDAVQVMVDSCEMRRVSDATLIADGAISTNKLVASAVTGDKIAANSVTAVKLASRAVTADKIDAGAITAEKLDANAINGKTITGSTIQTAGSGDAVRIGPDIGSVVTGKPWITMDGMAVEFDTGSTLNPRLNGFSKKTENGTTSSMNAISIDSGKTNSASGDGVVYAQSDPAGNSAAGFEVYDPSGNFAAGAWGIEDGHLYLCGFRANGMWSARDYEPVYRVKLDGSNPAKGASASYNISYAYPVPFGNRNVIGTAESTAPGLVFVPRSFSASGFIASFYNASGGGGSLILNFIAPWVYGGITWY
jgi:hypothetical protein